jgi:hypothetical protein
VTVHFKWTGPPDDVKSSSVSVEVPGETSRTTHSSGPPPPVLSVIAVEPKTLQHVYSGSFTTDVPLRPNVLYRFRAEVKNSLQDNVWHASALDVGSARNFRSVGDFFRASSVSLANGLRHAMPAGTAGLRTLLGV